MPASAPRATTSSCSTSRRTRRRGWIRRRPSTRRWPRARPLHMVPAIRNILGGFLFSGDDVYKRVRVLSGGERTRLAVARMLLRPSNTLLLDEPTNHLDLDSKEVLLDALADYGGTLIFVSHDRYFVERLATKIIEVGNGTAARLSGHLLRVPVAQGTSGAGRRRAGHERPRPCEPEPPARERSGEPGRGPPRRSSRTSAPSEGGPSASDKKTASSPPEQTSVSREEKKRADAEARKKSRAEQARRARIEDARSPDRRDRAGDPRARTDHGRPRLLRRPRRGPAGHRPAPGADVASRRSDAPVGGTPVRGRPGHRCRRIRQKRTLTHPSFDYSFVILIAAFQP